MPEPEFLIHPKWGFKVYSPMKINSQPDPQTLQSLIESHDYIISQKIDGAWFQLQKINDNNIHLFSRTISKKDNFFVDKIDNVPHIKEWAKCLPNETTLIGEIYIPGGKSNNVTSIMGCLAPTSIQRQFNSNAFGGPVHYYVHDCIQYDGQEILDKPLSERLDIMTDIKYKDLIEEAHYLANWSNPIFDEIDYNEYINNIFAIGGEGVVLKRLDGIYEPGKRPMTNRKVKEHRDNIDLVVMDCLDPEKIYTGTNLENWPYWDGDVPVTKPYYNGWKNALRVGAFDDNGKLIEVGRVASGLTDELREAIGRNPSNYINMVVECACMSVDNNEHTLRHPVFVRFRPDKDIHECKISEIFS